MLLRSLASDELIARGVNARFARVLADPGSYDPDLCTHIGETDWDYFVPENVNEIVPLWDVNADSIVRWDREGVREYVWLFHDDPNWSLIAKTEQGIMAWLWQSWAEFQESDEECRRFADAIGFRHCNDALVVWDKGHDALKLWILELRDD